MIPTPVHVYRAPGVGWYVTVEVAHKDLCHTLDCDGKGWYGVLVESERELSYADC